MTGRAGKIQAGDVKSGGNVRRKSAKMLDFWPVRRF